VSARPTQYTTQRISECLWILWGDTNRGVIRGPQGAIVIDPGDATILDALSEIGVDRVELVVLTHYHRDTAGAARLLAENGAEIAASSPDAESVTAASQWWSDPADRYHVYDFRPHRLMPLEDIPVTRRLAPGEVIEWGNARIEVVATPGHTDGGLSYVVDCGDTRIAFTGDSIYDYGRVWDVHSLQKKGVSAYDYHGFLNARDELIAGLRQVESFHPAALVPAHGHIITDVSGAIDSLEARLRDIYAEYAGINAQRNHRHEKLGDYARREPPMPISAHEPPPDWARSVGTSWVLISDSGAAFLMDGADASVAEALRQWRARAEISTVEAIWITHYHDDHVEMIPELKAEFGCPVIADDSVARVVERPSDWRLPCLSAKAIPIDRRSEDGETWQWREFTITAFHLPGQSIHHGGLLVEKDGLRVLFVGDSFTPGGLDDYCPQNRNPIGCGWGYDKCLDLCERLRPDLLANAHHDYMFRFSNEQYRMMRESLVRRRALLAEVLP